MILMSTKSKQERNIMFICENLAIINEIVENNKPRPHDVVVREFIEDNYPDCTIDANGRAHSPYKGYIDNNGVVWGGGEYLPSFEDMDDFEIVGRIGKRFNIVCFDINKKEKLTYDLSKGQFKKTIDEFKMQTEKFDVKNSKFNFNVKDRIKLKLTVEACFQNPSAYGDTFTYKMRDENLNLYMWKSSKQIEEFHVNKTGYVVKKGRIYDIVGTVKSNYATKQTGKKITILTRCKVC